MNEQLSLSIETCVLTNACEALSLAQESQLAEAKAASLRMDAILKARAAGEYLKKAKEEFGSTYKQWHSAKIAPTLNEDMSARFIRLANMPLEAFQTSTGIKTAQLCLGLIEVEAREDGQHKAHPDANKWISYLNKSTGEINKLIERSPIDSWDTMKRAVVKKTIEPLVRIYEKL